MQSFLQEDTVSPLSVASESEMKLDMDLIRKILLEVESWTDLTPKEVKIHGADDLALTREVERLYDNGYIEGICNVSDYRSPCKLVKVKDLSMKGFDFLNSIRDPEVWNEAKKGVQGGFTLDLFKDLAKGLIKKKIEDHTGVKLS
jgi:Hypothetical protein (DUF2513)